MNLTVYGGDRTMVEEMIGRLMFHFKFAVMGDSNYIQ